MLSGFKLLGVEIFRLQDRRNVYVDARKFGIWRGVPIRPGVYGDLNVLEPDQAWPTLLW